MTWHQFQWPLPQRFRLRTVASISSGGLTIRGKYSCVPVVIVPESAKKNEVILPETNGPEQFFWDDFKRFSSNFTVLDSAKNEEVESTA